MKWVRRPLEKAAQHPRIEARGAEAPQVSQMIETLSLVISEVVTSTMPLSTPIPCAK